MDATVEIDAQAKGRERRVHSRITRVMLTVRFAGQTYKTANWSMGGFFIDDYEGGLSTGSLGTVAGLGRSARSIRKVEVPARVVRSSESVIAVNFLSLDAEAHGFLQQVMSETGTMRILLDESA